MKSDRFLVQLTKIDGDPKQNMNPDEVRKLWDQASKEKTSVESYKLKVEFAQEVLDLLEKTTGEKVDQPKQAPTVGPIPDATQAHAQRDLYTSFKGAVADKQLDATIEANKRATQKEETKEKPDVARISGKRNYPDLKTTGPAMEEIKE